MQRLLLIMCLVMAFAAPTGVSAQSAVRAGVLPAPETSPFGTIQGRALDSNGESLPEQRVRLRDARFGRLVNEQLTDDEGRFEFSTIDPGSYVVELIGHDRRVLAATRLLVIEANDLIAVVVKLPYKTRPLAGFLGHSLGQAATILSVAAGLGVLAVEVTGEEISPN